MRRTFPLRSIAGDKSAGKAAVIDRAVHAGHEGHRPLRLVAVLRAVRGQEEPDVAGALRQTEGRRHCLRADQSRVLGVVHVRAAEAVRLLFRIEDRLHPGVDQPLNVMAPLVTEHRPPEDLHGRVVGRPRGRVVDGLIGGAIRARPERRIDRPTRGF